MHQQKKNQRREEECLYYYRLMGLEVVVYPRKIEIRKSGDPNTKKIIHNNGNSVTQYSVLTSNPDFLLVAVDQPASLFIINLSAYAQELIMRQNPPKNSEGYTIIEKNNDLLEHQLIDSCVLASEQPKKSNRIYLILKQPQKQVILLRMMQYNRDKVHEYDAVYRTYEINDCTQLLRNKRRFFLRFSYDISKFVMILNKSNEFQFVLCKPKNERGDLVLLFSKQNVRDDLEAVLKVADIWEFCENQRTFSMLVYNPNKRLQVNERFNNQGCLCLLIFKQNPIFDKNQTSSILFSQYYTNNPILSEIPLKISLEASLKSIISTKVSFTLIEIDSKNALFYSVLVKLDVTGNKELSAICYLVEEFGRNQVYEFRFYGFEEPCAMSVQIAKQNEEYMLKMAYLTDNTRQIKYRSLFLSNKKNYEKSPINSPSIEQKASQKTQKKELSLPENQNKPTIKIQQASSSVNDRNQPIKGFIKAEEINKETESNKQTAKSLIAPALLKHVQKKENQMKQIKESKAESDEEVEAPTKLVNNFSFGPKEISPVSKPQYSKELMSFGKQNVQDKQTVPKPTQERMNIAPVSPDKSSSTKIPQAPKQKQQQQVYDVRILTKIINQQKKYQQEISDSIDKFQYFYSNKKLQKLFQEIDISQFVVFDKIKELNQICEILKLVNLKLCLKIKKKGPSTSEIEAYWRKISNIQEILIKKWFRILMPGLEEPDTKKTKAITKFYEILRKSHPRISHHPSTQSACVTDRCFTEIQKLQQKIGYLQYKIQKLQNNQRKQQPQSPVQDEASEGEEEDFKIIVTSADIHKKTSQAKPKKNQYPQKQSKQLMKQRIYEKFIKKPQRDLTPEERTSTSKQNLKKWKNFPIFRIHNAPSDQNPQIKLAALV